MKVLVACEYSGVVRDAFLDCGCQAVSCDLLPSESDRGEHYKGDVRDILNDGWDMLVAFPMGQYQVFPAISPSMTSLVNAVPRPSDSGMLG